MVDGKEIDANYSLVSGIADIEYKNSNTKYEVKFS